LRAIGATGDLQLEIAAFVIIFSSNTAKNNPSHLSKEVKSTLYASHETIPLSRRYQEEYEERQKEQERRNWEKERSARERTKKEIEREFRHTDKKENKIFLIYKEIHMGAVAKSYMGKRFLIYEEMRKYIVIYEEAVNHIHC
jgi:hypothetical protein